MRLNRRLLVGGSVLALLSGTAACGMQSIEPKIQLRDALRAFGDQSSGAVRLSVPSSEDDVRAFIEAVDDTSGDADVPDDVLRTLLSTSVVHGYDSGEDDEDPADDAVRTVVEIGDLTAVEVRAIGETVYTRADVDGLLDEFPDLAADVDSFRAELDGVDGAPSSVPEALLAPARALLDGGWVSVDGEVLLAQLEELGGTPSAGQEAQLQSDLQELAGKALQDAVVGVERTGEDDDLGDQLTVRLNLRKGYETVRDGLPAIVPDDVEDEAVLAELPPADEVPDKDVEVSVWVQDGELTRAELDAAQFLDDPAGHLVLRLDALEAQPVTAPSDAVAVDVATLLENGLASFVPGADVPLDAHTIATWVDMDLAGLAAEQGTEPSVALLPELLPYYEGMTPDLLITAVGPRIEVTTAGETACLTPSPDGMAEDVLDGPC
ncbi:hypothetical protein GCU60_04370 [Blastococcus saxobsidens]|uniref:Lipoprotein n=1 Tax=Blastococcus saxobsidens TaxID=138336 RepID=A0A6L9VYX8_9ACTN|nr:hypothetical protein [Blastococcus saxobsidens]NEK84997.1 hypothetical protein [Blastococcus saxobsidens]